MKFFICPDKFKGSASSEEVIQAINVGILRVISHPHISSAPISDGGEAFAHVVSQNLPGKWVSLTSQDALSRPINARYFISENCAYIDLCNTSGLDQIEPEIRNPMASSSYGTGIVIKDAVERHCVEKIFIGLGGSATNDGGAGIASALGVRFLDNFGAELDPTPNELIHCSAIDASSIIELPPIVAACDVNNPLLGENGATYVYGPQKGVIECCDLDSILANLVAINSGEQASTIAGAGAAGGAAYALLHYCNAKLESGFDLIASITSLEQNIKNADIIITGEGSLDAQTLNGKGPHKVAQLARKHGKKVFAIAGRVEPCAQEIFSSTYSLSDQGIPYETCVREAPSLIANQAEKLANDIILDNI